MPQMPLVRHAQASFGGDDYDVLSDVGHRQATALRGAVASRAMRPARIASGTMRRQLDTARTVGQPEVDSRWNEYDKADVHHERTSRSLAAGTLALPAPWPPAVCPPTWGNLDIWATTTG